MIAGIAAAAVLFAMPLAGQEFEVASIKLNAGLNPLVHVQPSPGGRLLLENVPLRVLIQYAYGIRADQIVGGPAWTGSDGYDITARAEGNPAGTEMMGPMLRALLERRFKLAVHRETRQHTVFSLFAAKGGSKLKPSIEGGCVPFSLNTPPPPRLAPGEKQPNYCGFLGLGVAGAARKLDMMGVSMSELAGSLSHAMRQPVTDRSGISGKFDVHLSWTSDDTDGPSIETALQEQLGLRLESGKGPLEVVVIDRVERPSEN